MQKCFFFLFRIEFRVCISHALALFLSTLIKLTFYVILFQEKKRKKKTVITKEKWFSKRYNLDASRSTVQYCFPIPSNRIHQLSISNIQIFHIIGSLLYVHIYKCPLSHIAIQVTNYLYKLKWNTTEDDNVENTEMCEQRQEK